MRTPVPGRDNDAKPTILVIDDDVLSLELYTRELSSNYDVIACEHVEEAQRYLHSNPLSAVILEPAINDDNGWMLLEEIHASLTPPPVVVCSVLDERKVGLEQAAEAFLVKPVLPFTLHQLIDRIVSRRNAKTAS